MSRWGDGFCGGGGSASGMSQVPEVEVVVAMNHWQLAVDVHNANHPNTHHICADISQYDPRRAPRTDCHWWSPECTNHSQGKGVKRVDVNQPDIFGEVLPDAAAERSRATMWDVVRFAEHHRHKAVVVENVVEVAKWAPFPAWLQAMQSLGYEHKIVSLNSMHAQAGGLPAPQSRDRVYIVFWRKGNRAPELAQMQRPRAFCRRCDTVVESRQAWKNGRTVGRYRQQYVYVCSTPGCGQVVEPGWLPAAAAIDWSLPGMRIGDRAKPLAEKTRRRIAAGIARYWHPVHLEAAGHTWDAASPKHREFDNPNGYYRAWSMYDALKTLHADASKALAIPSGGTWSEDARPLTEPHRTMTTREHMGVLRPFIAELRGGGSTARSVDSAMATVTAAGNHHALVTPYYGASERAKPTSEAIGALTTVDRYALVMRNNGGGAEMTTPAGEPLRTLTTAGHQSILTPGDIKAAEAQVDDCLFRMLEPGEVARGMAFPEDYAWQGTRRERVRMAGNAVTPPAARDLVAAVEATLDGAA